MAFNKEKAIATAKKFIEKGQIDKAILEYRRIVEAEPEDVKCIQKLAELYVRQGSRQDAINQFLKLADLLIKQGFSNRAISIYKQILQLNPLLIPVYIKLSEIFKTLGLSKESRIFNQRAVEIVQKAGSVEDVYKLLMKIIEIDPEDAISRIALAETCLKMSKNQAAISQFEATLPILRVQHLDDLFIRAAERLLFHKPDNVELCRELAILFMTRKEVPKAMKLLLHCRKLDPEDLDTLDLLIGHFLTSQNHEKAVLVLLEKSKLLARKGRESEAQLTLRKILEIDPTNQEARRSLKDKEPYSWEDVHPPQPAPAAQRGLPPPPPRPAAPAAAPVESAVQEEIESKYIEEAEIFIKYGLREKALEHLFRGIEETYGAVKVREKLKDLYLDMGDIPLGLEQLHLLAQQVREYNPAASQLYLKEILLINPNDPKARRMLEALGQVAPAPQAAALLDEPVMPLEHVLGAPPPARQTTTPDYSSFLEEETSDVIHSGDAPSEISSLEEPFLDSDFPPPPLAAPAISHDELQTLETETMEETPSDEISALETETVEDMNFPVEPRLKPSLELAHGPRPPAIDQVLDECDFFAAQGLIQEALLLLEDLSGQYSDNALIVDKISELRSRQAQEGALAPKLSAKPLAAASQWGQAEEISVSQVTDEAIEELGALEKIISPAEFEERVEEAMISTPSEIDATDAQTHHDLGIAYMEMGLWDQAIAEFRIGAQNPQMEATSYDLIGNCLAAAGSIDEAIKEYKLGLFAKNKTPEQEMGLYYDIAQAYVKLDDYKEALYYLQNIRKKKPDYKDVNEKIAEITSSFNKAIVEKEEKAERKRTAAPSPKEAAKEVDEAFDNLFGDFPPKKK